MAISIFAVAEENLTGTGINLLLDVGSLRSQRSGGPVISGPLTTDAQIDYAIDRLHGDLEALRASAKEKLNSLFKPTRGTWAQPID
jgi:hypothetical protein